MYLTREKIAISFDIIRGKNPDLKSNPAVLSYKESIKLKSLVQILISINSPVQQWNSLNSILSYLHPCKIWISFQTPASERKVVLFGFLGRLCISKNCHWVILDEIIIPKIHYIVTLVWLVFLIPRPSLSQSHWIKILGYKKRKALFWSLLSKFIQKHLSSLPVRSH